MFHTATYEDVRAARTTDVYFQRTLQVLEARGVDKRVRAEFIAKSLPDDWEWAVLAGIEECLNLVEDLDFSVRAMPEGTLFRTYEPILEIEGLYSHFCAYETPILGLLCQASGVATRAARCKALAGERTVLSFGARRMHPTLTPMLERNAYVGGCDGVSAVQGAELIGIAPTGTMPHALVLMLGSTVEATEAFHEAIDPAVQRVSLIDTFQDEKFAALEIAEAMGENLFAVRLDTPASRRGDFYRLLEEVRWELDIRGHGQVNLFVSGGITEELIPRLNPLVSGYGIGTTISNAPVVDLSMDIIEIEGRPWAKRGKMSGSKSVWRCRECRRDQVTLAGRDPGPCDCGGEREELLRPLSDGGAVVADRPTASEIRSYVLAQLPHFEL